MTQGRENTSKAIYESSSERVVGTINAVSYTEKLIVLRNPYSHKCSSLFGIIVT